MSRIFYFYLVDRFLSIAQYFAMTVALGQYVFTATRNPLDLGYVGLALFVPRAVFSLFSGEVADRFAKRDVMLIGRACAAVLSGLLAFWSGHQTASLAPMFVLLFLIGTADAFSRPSSQAFLPELVPERTFTRAVAWASGVFQAAIVSGPLFAGWGYAVAGEARPIFVFCAVANCLCVFILTGMPRIAPKTKSEKMSWKTLSSGLRYVFANRLILGVISLDLFAVLFGGAVSLMPIFANDILGVGPAGLGWLRAAPSIGAVATSFFIARDTKLDHAGTILLVCVATFGLATVGFGVSRDFYLSLALLFVLGAADMVSVIVRGVLVQTKTPPEMRGRVSAVNMVFIGASNELGEFESGVTAGWFGTVPAVVIGGIGTLAVVGLWAWLFPEIRRVENL